LGDAAHIGQAVGRVVHIVACRGLPREGLGVDGAVADRVVGVGKGRAVAVAGVAQAIQPVVGVSDGGRDDRPAGLLASTMVCLAIQCGALTQCSWGRWHWLMEVRTYTEDVELDDLELYLTMANLQRGK
jgi:hypothetical protein